MQHQSLPPEIMQELVGLYTQSRHRELADRARSLIAEIPQSHQLYNFLGAAEAGLGRIDAALAAYAKSVEIKPDYAEAHSNTGATLFLQARYDEALLACQKALAIAPGHPHALSNLGASLCALARYEEAEAPLLRAAKAQPGNPEILGNLGTALYKTGRQDAAFEVFEAALKVAPDNPQAMLNYGIALRDLGQRDEAVALFEKVLALRPDLADAHYHLAMLKRFGEGDPQIGELERLVAGSGPEAHGAVELRFALARAYDNLAKTGEAFEQYAEANRIRRRRLSYDIGDDRALFALIKEAFAEPKPVSEAPVTTGKVPVFIVGMPRSGTTLVEQILASHPQVHGAGEIGFLEAAVRAVDWQDTGAAAEVRRRYLSGLQTLGASEPFITDKLPLNFRWIGFIRAALPEARIVHVQRDARATCWSVFTNLFGSDGTGFGYDLREVAEYYALYDDLMRCWDQSFPGHVHHLDYEKLTEDQEAETRSLLDFVGLDWDPACLEFYKTRRRVATLSTVQVRRPIYTGSSDVWHRYEPMLQDMLSPLGKI